MTGQKSFGSTKDLIDKIARQTGESLNSTSARQRILDLLNMRYLMVLSGKKWRFLRGELYFDLTAPYTTGTATVSKGSTTVTGIGTSWDSSMVGQKFLFPGDEAIYEVDSVVSGTELELKSNYTDESKSSANYKIIFDTYKREEDIDSINEAYLGGISGSSPTLQLVGLDYFREQQKSSSLLEGQPRMLTAYVENDLGDPDWVMELWPAPSRAHTLLIEYDQSVSELVDSEINYPVIPNKYQFVLFWAVVADVLADQKEMNGAQVAGSKFSAAYQKFCSDYEMTDSRPRVKHDKSYLEMPRSRSRFRHGRSGRQRITIT